MKKRRRMIYILLMFTLFTGAAWLLRGAIMQYLQQGQQVGNTKLFTVIAHRGASLDAPENTLAAFRRAMIIGADWIELDVHLSKDGEIVVIHDAVLGRTSTGEGSVRSKSWKELQELDAGSWMDKSFGSEKIPSLAQVMQLVQGQAKLLIEIKVDEHNELYEGLVKAILALIEERQAKEWCILQAFDSHYLEEIAASGTSVRYHKLMVDDLKPLPVYIDTGWKLGWLDRAQGYTALNSYYKLLTPQKIAECHSQGLEVYPYTVDDAQTMSLLVKWGVDGVITNDPATALKLQNR